MRGFQNSGCIEDELTNYFNAYGKVSNIFLDKDKVCTMPYHDVMAVV